MAAVIKMAVLFVALAYFTYVCLETYRKYIPRIVIAESILDRYDYVVIGAGSAGCVLANRLTEDPEITVLLLEAGGDDSFDPEFVIPENGGSLWAPDHPLNWGYVTNPQRHSHQSMVGKRGFWPRGKALGGTSTINTLVYVRGDPADYDRWAEHGATGWAYEDVLPYFVKAEGNQDMDSVDARYHGSDGPVIVSHGKIETPLQAAFVQGGVELGYRAEDYNGPRQLGAFSAVQTTTKGGIRWSAASAYLRPAMHRPNLDILPEAHVTRILFNGTKAIGVSYLHNGRLLNVFATREVLLSAGSIASPQLLLLSGIGPQEHLEQLGIPVIADLPVGQNLQDHIMLYSPEWTLTEPVSCRSLKKSSFWSYLQYILFGVGDASRGNHMLAEGFVPLEGGNSVQLQLLGNLIGVNTIAADNFRRRINVDKDIFWKLFGNMENQEGFSIILIQTHPQSVGYIRLSSRDPLDHPEIEPNYFSFEEEVKTMRQGIRVIQKLLKTKPFLDLGSRQHHVTHPHCASNQYDSDAYWECYLRNLAVTGFHPVGTCEMGGQGDQSAVVGPDLRVKGVRGLRVIDASIMPTHISGNINAAVIMIAEKAADLISNTPY